MAKNPNEPATDETVDEPVVVDAPVATEPVAPGASVGGSFDQAHGATLRPLERRETDDGQPYVVDPEIEERNARIAEKQAELDALKQNERRRMVDAERAMTIEGLDQREAELDAQLARVRGDRPEEQ